MEQNVANELIMLYAKQLRLPSFNKFSKVIQQLEPSESYADFFLKLMKTELDDRQHTAQEKRIKTAKFPTKKRSMNFEHISEGCIRELATCDFIGKRQNVIMVGNPGSVKTYLAIALANKLSEALQEGRLSKLEWSLSRFDLLIIDELSYLTFNSQILNMNCTTSYRMEAARRT